MSDGSELSYRDEPAPVLRKIIARRMAESKVESPHFYLTVDVDAGPIAERREAAIAETGRRISFNDLLVKDCATILMEHPECNVSYIDDKIRYYDVANICLAVAVPDGLLTPTITACQRKSIIEISEQSAALVDKAKRMKLRPREGSGGTFTISNLGMYGIESFSAIINPPQSMILAVGAIRDTPVVVDGEIQIGKRMKLTLSCDHRVIDGSVAAVFLSALKDRLEASVNAS